MRIFGELTKIEDQPDGSIHVFGVASSSARDDAGEIVTPDAMKAALPDYAKYPALREMHQASAAGRTLEAEVDGDGFTRIVAHVVDPVAIAKVKSKTYAGFSIGGKVLKRDPTDRTIITAIKLGEISLVDRPCNPEASIDLWKADLGQGDEMAEYAPTNDEVKARAGEMAKAAGKTAMDAFKGYVVQAREALIAEHAPSEATEALQDAAKAAIIEELRKAAPDLTEDDAAAIVTLIQAEHALASAERTDIADAVAKALAARAAPEPSGAAAVLAAALAKAKAAEEAVAVPEAVDPHPITVGLADLGKTLVLLHKLHAEDLAKGMYQVSRLAELIDALSSLQSSTVWEARDEGDGSAVPQMLTDGIKQLGDTLLSMAQEEVAELLAALAARGIELGIVVVDDADVEIVLAAKAIDLVKADTALMEKAGARHSKADKEHLQAAHDHMTKLGAMCDPKNCPADDEAAAKAAAAEDLNKVALEAAEAIIKQSDELADLRKHAAGEADRTAKAIEDALTKFRQEPVPPRTAASSHVVIGKAEDASPGTTPASDPAEDEVAKRLEAMSDEERALVLIKAAHKLPYRPKL